MDGVVDLAVKALHGGEVMLEAAAQAQIRPGATAVRRGWGSAVAGREKGEDKEGDRNCGGWQPV